MSVPYALEADDVTVTFGGLVALDHVSLEVRPGTILGLIGPNGAGKTTCFGVLSGILRPRTGRVRLFGHDVTRASPQARAHRGLARTFQRLELFMELTVREHVLVAMRSRHRSRPARRIVGQARDLLGLTGGASPEEARAVDEILDLLGLRALAAAPASILGLGTGRLVELARALAGDPRVVLLDEPSSGLDASETGELAAVLRLLRAERDLALVLVEHNVEMVLGLADDVTVLDFGEVIATGPPEQIRADPAVQAAYLGTTA
jgi:branched-chain amino acid transport system ATP-binding protein